MYFWLLTILLLFCCLYYGFISIKYNNTSNIQEVRKVENHKSKNTESSMSQIFSNIYKTKYWGKGSGMGSYRECTENYRIYLKDFIYSNHIKKIIDLGCGDWQMLSHFNFSSDVYYYGYDVVKDLVENHNKTFKKENINFYYLINIEDRIEDGDLIMTKDVLQHWENKYIKYFLENILAKYKYGIIVNDFKNNTENRDINIGNCRPLNLETSPFFYKDFKSHRDMMFCRNYKRIYIKSS